MILDKLMQFDPAATAASAIVAAGVASTNVLDLANYRDLGGKNWAELAIVFTIGTVFAASGGAANLVVALQGSVDNTTYKNICRTAEIPKANLTANQRIILSLSSYLANPELVALGIPRYLRAFYTAITNDFTTGDFQADLVVNPQQNNPATYAAGVTVAN